jgi:hypothetical protein
MEDIVHETRPNRKMFFLFDCIIHLEMTLKNFKYEIFDKHNCETFEFHKSFELYAIYIL